MCYSRALERRCLYVTGLESNDVCIVNGRPIRDRLWLHFLFRFMFGRCHSIAQKVHISMRTAYCFYKPTTTASITDSSSLGHNYYPKASRRLEFLVQVFGLHLVGGSRAGLADRGPLKVPREEHVPDEGLDRRLAHEAHEEQLLYDGRRHRPEGGQSQQQLPEPGRLVGVLTAAVLLECALTLFLKLLDDCCISESRCIYGNNEVLATILSAL